MSTAPTLLALLESRDSELTAEMMRAHCSGASIANVAKAVKAAALNRNDAPRVDLMKAALEGSGMSAHEVFGYDDGAKGTSAMHQACLAGAGTTKPLEALIQQGGVVLASMISHALYGVEHQPAVAVAVVKLLLEHTTSSELPQEALDVLEDAREDFDSEEQKAALDKIGQLMDEARSASRIV